MLNNIWEYIQVPEHQSTLTWIGGGIAAVIVAIWGVIKFFFSKKDTNNPESLDVSSKKGSVAVGGNVTRSPINVGNRVKNNNNVKR